MAFAWNDDNIKQLVSMYQRGCSFGEIGNEIGCSRNAAIGKVHRMKLEPRRKPRIASVIDAVKRVFKPAPKKIAVEKKATTVWDNLDWSDGSRCRTDELSNDRCHFPMWPHGSLSESDRFYCGAPGADVTGRRPYCEYHRRLCNPQNS